VWSLPEKFCELVFKNQTSTTASPACGVLVSGSAPHAPPHPSPAAPPQQQVEEEEEAAEDAEVLYCFCQEPFEPDRTMVECESCSEWYHLPCLLERTGVLIFEHEIADMGSFFCTKAACAPNNKFTAAELAEWGGSVVDAKVQKIDDRSVTVFQVQWNDGTPSTWMEEDGIANELLEVFRSNLRQKDIQAAALAGAQAPAASKGCKRKR